MRDKSPWFSTVIGRALEQDRTVKITPGDRGFHLEIDGQRMTLGDGLPMETFEWKLWDRRGPNAPEDAMDLADEILLEGEDPPCPECYGHLKQYTVVRDGFPVTLSYCRRCPRTVTEDGGQR